MNIDTAKAIPSYGACITRRIHSLSVTLLASFALLGFLHAQGASAQSLPDFNVNSVADKVDATPGDGICSTGSTVDGHTPECTLRAAIDEVNALQTADLTRHFVVTVMAGTYSLSTTEKCVYTDFGSPPLVSYGAALCISSNLTLNGANQATTIVDHALVDKDFFVSYGYTAAINNMTIQHGGQYGGSYDGGGGGVNNQGNLTLSNDLLFSNHSDVGGAGVDNSGTLVVEGSTFLANSGPALTANYANTSIDGSYFTQNTAGQGPAVSTYLGTLQISNSTVSANTVGVNGIISANNTVVTMTNSTISNNTVGNAGAVVLSGRPSTLNNVTISGNTSGNSVGGLLGDTISISNTILAGNSGYDCSVSGLTDLGHNLIQTPNPRVCSLTDPTTLTGVDARLGAVTLDGGLIPTQDPLPGSPAIGAGSSATPGSNAAGACTSIDERGSVRGRNGACSIGAAEPLGGLAINNISPNAGAPGGTAWVLVHGSGFVPGSTLSLSNDTESIPLPQTTVGADTLSVTALLDLSKVGLGTYDVVVTTPAGTSAVLKGGYTVVAATAPNLYSYIYGSSAARVGQPAFYTVVYGNRGNTDAYLVPLDLSLPGSFAGLLLSQVVAPPAAAEQVIGDWTTVPLEVTPYATTGATNVPLMIPVIPAGSQAVLRFSITPPVGTPHGSPYRITAELGTPYAIAPAATVVPASLAAFVAGAQDYAQTNLGVALSAADLARMSTYAASQLAAEVNEGGQALLASAAGRTAIFSSAQLLIDIATYGASLEGGTATTSSASRQQLAYAASRPDAMPGTGTGGAGAACSGQNLASGPNCQILPVAVPVATLTFKREACSDVPGQQVFGTTCVPISAVTCVPSKTHDCGTQIGTTVGSIDPNEKDGPFGVGAAHFTVASDPFQYEVEFENSPTADAPAQAVTVTDPLDKAQYDLSTFQLGPISFGPYRVTPAAGLTSFASALDLRPAENVIVTIRAGLDTSTGVATWNFTSLDPSTMQLITDPTAGFLPADTNPPAGIGHVAFSVQPLASLTSGTNICNTASIVFDVNAPLATAPFCNKKDTAAPTSSVQPLAAVQSKPAFTVSWSGTDAGVGIQAYTIYVSIDGRPFVLWLGPTASTTATYTGAAGHTYGFYSIATDQLGNTEAPKTRPEATTTVTTGAAAAIPAFSPGGGVYTSAQTVAISDATTGATVYYTTDGNLPTAQATVYTGPVTITKSETIQAIAVATAYTQSPVGTATYTITPAAAQTINFPSLGSQTYGAAPILLTATATSGLPVSYAVTGPAKLSGSKLLITGAGVVTVTASQSGNASYLAAPSVSRSFTIAKAALTATATSLTRAAGASNPPLTYTLSGFVEGDTASSLSGSAALATTALVTSPAGTYPITFSTENLSATNYRFNYVAGTLTISPGTLVIAPASGNFGNINVGATSPVMSFTVTNNTTSTMGYLGYTNLGEFFLQPGSCHLVNGEPMLNPGKSCVFTAVFKPTKPGLASGSLSIKTSSGTINVAMSGTGSTLVIAPVAGNFGKVAIGHTSPALSFTVTNDTASTMGYLGYSNLGEFYLQPGTCSLVNGEPMLKPGQSCVFTAVFKPTKPGPVTGTLSIQTSSGTFNVPMTGTGETP